MGGCTCPTRHLDPLGGATERVYPWAGVLILGIDYEDFAQMASGPAYHPYGGDLHRFYRGILRYMQGLGSPFLQSHGLRLLRATHDVITNPLGPHDAFEREAQRLAAPHPTGVSCEDILAAAAEVEAVKLMVRADPNLQSALPGNIHRVLLAQVHPDRDAPQRRGFDHLAARIGDEDACELLPLLTFLAFIHDDPCEAFNYLAGAAESSADALKAMTAAQVLDRVGWSDGYDSYWDRWPRANRSGRPTSRTRCAMRCVSTAGPSCSSSSHARPRDCGSCRKPSCARSSPRSSRSRRGTAAWYTTATASRSSTPTGRSRRWSTPACTARPSA